MKPYGYVRKDGEGLFIYGEHQFQNAMGAELVPVYLHPKEWVVLTAEEVFQCWERAHEPGNEGLINAIRMADEVEQALKEKNT
tara:strand:+ start:1061 stop:1309 length:249 start_codon:yes stop_codon:yes gene_type:complete